MKNYSSNENYGRYCSLISYFFCFIIYIYVLNTNTNLGSTPKFILTLIYFIIGFVPGVLLNEGYIDSRMHHRIYILGYTIMSFGLYKVMNYIPIFLIALFVQSILVLMYMDIELFAYQLVVATLSIVIFFFSLISKQYDFDRGIFLYIFISFILSNLVCFIIINCVEKERRKYSEQERSLDDMLHVVETKVDQARAAAKSKSDFLSSMSHEIRTPINTVLGMNEMIIRESGDDNITGYAQNIASSGNMLLSLVNDILDFSKIESGKLKIINVEYELSSVINDLIYMIKERAEKKGLGLRLIINENIPNFLFGDEVRIRQIVLNLLTNAVKYTDEGRITLNVDFINRSNGKIDLVLSVKDTGRGIKKEDIKRLFTSFERFEETRNRSIEGTGLGLSIVGGYVKLMHGKVDVVSDYGKGSEFIVTIPQKVVKRDIVGNFDFKFTKASNKAEKYKPALIAPKAKVLCVDDNKMNLIVVKNLLKSTKINLELVQSGFDCIEKLKTEKYHALLLDHMMPEMDGIETLNKIKEVNLAPNMPIIALTANAVSGAKENFIQAGFDDYLSKPIVPMELENMLIKWLPDELLEN